MDTLPGMVQVVALALRFVGLRMVPLIVSTIYHVLKHTFTYLYRTLTWCLVPVLLPLRILFYQPVMALASLLYNVRHLVYFAGMAVLIGSIMGGLSSLVTSKIGEGGAASAATHDQTKSKASKRSLRTKVARKRQAAAVSFDRQQTPSLQASTPSLETAMRDGRTTVKMEHQYRGEKDKARSTGSPGLIYEHDDPPTVPSTDRDRFQVALQALAERRRRLSGATAS